MKHFCSRTLAMAATFLVGGFAGNALAATIVDAYIGGTNPSGYVGADVVASPGDTRFNIDSMDVNHVLDNLVVQINTNYSGVNVGAGGTTLGDLFLGSIGNLSPTAFSNTNDTYVGNKSRFSYVLDYNTAPDTGPSSAFNVNDAPATQGGASTLYKLKGDGTDVLLTQDVTSGGFRRDQAVDIKDSAKAAAGTGINGTWSTVAGSVTFTITDFFAKGGLGATGGIFSTGLVLAWEMTCANDIILASVPFRTGGVPVGDVPLPAGIVLLMSGLAGIGVLGRLKSKASKARLI